MEETKRSAGRPAGLTNRQREFARYIVEGLYSNAECARKAGYAEGQAAKTASLFLNGRDYPHVVELVKELREEKERRYGVTLGQLSGLMNCRAGRRVGPILRRPMPRRSGLRLVA